MKTGVSPYVGLNGPRGYVRILTPPDALPVVPPAWVQKQMEARGAAWAFDFISSSTTGGIDRWRAKHPDLVAEIEAAAALVGETAMLVEEVL